jgi:chromate transport protein ChrA
VLIVLTCVLVPVALLTVWAHDLVLDTNQYVSTVAPLASNPAIEDAAVKRITQAADVRVDGAQVTSDIAAWLQAQGVPPRAAQAVKGLGPQLDDAVNSTVEKVATRFVQSDRFETIWTNANRAAHTAVVKVLTGQGSGAVTVSGGTVTLDVGAAVDQVKVALVDAGLSPAAKIPEVNKQMVLFQSDQLEKIRGAAHLLDVIGNWLPVIVALIGAAGVLLAYRRRRALAHTALGAAFACLVVAIVLVIVRHYYLDHLPPQVQSPAAAAAVFDTLLYFLRASLRTAIVLGVVIALGAYLIGPGRLPGAIRGASERAADSTAGWAYHHQIRTGRVGIWAQRQRRWIALAALLIVALLFALWNQPTLLAILLLVIILLAVLALLALLAASGRATIDAEKSAPPLPQEST